jgi:hypothetical protein
MPKNPKDSFLKRFEGRYSVRRVYGKSFYELNSTAILYFRYSKAHKNQFFYGVESDDVLRYKDSNLFILFICETEDEIVVLPIEHFLEMVRGTEPVSNQWKVFIAKDKGQYSLRVAGKGRYGVTENLNKFDFRPADFRTGSLPSVGKLTPLRRRREQKPGEEQVPISTSLEDRLVLASSDSKRPARFEETVREAFERLGFKVKRIGGAGNTDVLIEAPIRGIVDCKSTTGESLSSLNFARLKRHKKENEASFLLVIGRGFDRAVVRDAVMEQCTLMPVEVLKEILQVSRTYTVSPFEIEHLLKREGLVSLEDCQFLRRAADTFRSRTESVLRVIGSLDFNPRALKEIKGRLEYEAEQKGSPPINEAELSEMLVFLCSPVPSLATRANSNYSLKYSHNQSVEKLKQIFRDLVSPPAKE